MYILYTYISTYCDIYGFNLCGGRFLCWSNGWKTKREKKISNSLKEQITIIIIIITKKAGCMQFLTCTYIMLSVFIDFVRDTFKNRMDENDNSIGTNLIFHAFYAQDAATNTRTSIIDICSIQHSCKTFG